jgi:glucan 1,3-beta-glucosidase
MSGDIESPMWSYSLGLENGWIPTDPRTSVGKCSFYGVNVAPFNNSYQSWQTGGASAGTIQATSVETFGQWPPPTLSGVSAIPMSEVPTYTQTAAAITLPMPTFTNGAGKTVSVSADGWAQPTDTAGGVTTVADCVYPDPWTIGTASTASCTGSGQASMGSAAIASVPITSAATPTA